MTNPQTEKRENDQEIDRVQTDLHGIRATQRLRYLWLCASLASVGFLGWALLVGVWTNYRGPFSIIGFVAVTTSTAFASWHILKMRPEIGQKEYGLLVLQTKRLHLAAAEEADPSIALRIYKVKALDDLEQYRRSARRSRRSANLLQWTIIVGSVTATSLTSANTASSGSLQSFRWIAAVVSAVVSIAAGVTGFFKFRERSFNQQLTADAIDKHYKAVDLGIGEYHNLTENERLSKFAQQIEELKDEQRKRELQLEQSTSDRREHQTA
jgi:uncharacterized membrane protein